MNEYETVSKSVKIDVIDGLKDRLPQIFEDGKINGYFPHGSRTLL